MSLQEFAWLGASMSGVGVLASIIYVSIQIRNNTRALCALRRSAGGLNSSRNLLRHWRIRTK
jgi:hypothetical protein